MIPLPSLVEANDGALHEASAPQAENEPLVSYAYSYPHKSSYRPLSLALPLRDVWARDEQSQLALYLHIPFCEMRCGFCNLFTQSQPVADQVVHYVETVKRQMRVVRNELPSARFAMFALGGGTPTFLEARQLDDLLASVESTFDFDLSRAPTSVETSPATADHSRLSVLAAHGIERISIGVQSFIEAEARAFGRPQQRSDVIRALELIRSHNFPVLNIDLIYGDEIQTRASWQESLDIALSFDPEELYLYPLYVRPETGLARTGHRAAQHRIDLYRCARDRLLENGYEQLSLRCFRRLKQNTITTLYSCQRDGMIGLGCGARSYSRDLHYGTLFAVTQAGVRAILTEWMQQTDEELQLATHGIWLSDEEQRRRFVILGLLQCSGLSIDEYRAQFYQSPIDDIPELADLTNAGWLQTNGDRLTLTETGIEHSDTIGPLLYSNQVRKRLREFVRLK